VPFGMSFSIYSDCLGSWVMPRRVVDLFASWWIAGSTWSAVVWKIVLSWCL
jgi:hypothetical protein